MRAYFSGSEVLVDIGEAIRPTLKPAMARMTRANQSQQVRARTTQQRGTIPATGRAWG
ncbi:MAG TPA: hypothetical protein VFY14_22845 [Streptomyces sp.]|nr:hypothetical protein [Streptomyces sp.]